MTSQTVNHDEPLSSSLQLSFPLSYPTSFAPASAREVGKQSRKHVNSLSFYNFEPTKSHKGVSASAHSSREHQARKTRKHDYHTNESCRDAPGMMYHRLLDTDILAEKHSLAPPALAWLEHCAAHGCGTKENDTQTKSKGKILTAVQKLSSNPQAVAKSQLVYNKNDYFSESHAKEADSVDVKTLLVSDRRSSTLKGHTHKGNSSHDDSQVDMGNGACGRCNSCRLQISHRMTKRNEMPCKCQHRCLVMKSSARRTPLVPSENELVVTRKGSNEFSDLLKGGCAKKMLSVDTHKSVFHDLTPSPQKGNSPKRAVRVTTEKKNDTQTSTHTSTSSFPQPQAGAATTSASRERNDGLPESPLALASGASRLRTEVKGHTGPKRPKSSSLENKKTTASTEGERKKGNPREEALRSRFVKLCMCYWSYFPELGMPINTASHAPTCPCHDKQSEYEVAVISSEEAYEDCLTAGVTCSRSSSFNDKSESSKDEDQQSHEYYTRGGEHKEITSLAGRHRKTKEVCIKGKDVQTRKQATANAVGSTSRSAIFGAARRRTLFDEIMEGRSASVGSTSSARCSSLATSPRSPRQWSRASSRTQRKEDGSRSVNRVAAVPHLMAPEVGKADSMPQSSLVDGNLSAAAAEATEGCPDPYQSSPTFPTRSPKSSHVTTASTRADQKGVLSDEAAKQARSRSRSCSRRSLRHRRDTSPGPGAYDVLLAYTRSSEKLKPRQVSFGKATRRTLEGVTTSTETPGPGTYDILPSTAALVVQETNKNNEGKGTLEVMPGPAAPFLSTSPRVLHYQPGTCPPPVGSSGGEVTPGPGQYALEKVEHLKSRHPSSPAYSFGKLTPQSARLAPTFLSEASASGCRAQGVAAPPSPTRAALSGEKDTHAPGPADYDARTGEEIGASGRSAVLGTSVARSTSPLSDNRAVVSGVVRLNKESEAPGPGSYAPDAADRWVRPKTPSYSFSGHSKAVSPLPWDVISSPIPDQGSHLLSWIDTSLPRLGPSRCNPIGGGFTAFQHRSASQRPHDARQGHSNSPSGHSRSNSLAPAVTRGDRSSYDTCGSVTPGPGEYMPLYTTQQRSFKGYSFGTAPRSIRSTTAAHNASNHDLPNPRRERSPRPSLPGPGDYAVSVALKQIGGVIAKAPRPDVFDPPTARLAASPGPGTYALDAVVTTANRPSAVIGRTARQGLFTLLTDSAGCRGGCPPGPGAYELPALLPVGPVSSFARSARSFAETTQDGTGVAASRTPGPNAYDVAYPSSQTVTVVGPSLSRAPRFVQDLLEEKYKSSIPGSGAYDVVYDQRSVLKGAAAAGAASRGAVFGTAPRGSRIGDSGDGGSPPGPGSYDPQYTSLDASPRSVLFVGAHSRAGLDTCAVLKHINQEDQSGESTGPGAYDLNVPSDIPTYPRTTFSQAPRSLDVQEHYPNVNVMSNDVGPGTYSPVFVNVGEHQRAAVIGTAPRTVGERAPPNGEGETQAITPGPGSYEVCVTRDGHRIPYDASEADTLRHMRGPATFGTASNPRNALDGVPGANYNSSGPGPGAYSVADNTAFGSGSPGALMGTQKRFAEDYDAYAGDKGLLTDGVPAQAPGPGYYQPSYAHVEARTPAFRFGGARGQEGNFTGRSVFSAADDIPGPGEYDTGAAMQHSGQPAHSFVTAVRFPEDAVRDGKICVDASRPETVGPGSYDVSSLGVLRNTTRSAPAFSFPCASTARDAVYASESASGERGGAHRPLVSSTEGTPGPGAYQTTDGAYLTRPSLPVYTFGAANRFHASPGESEDFSIPVHKGANIVEQSLGPGSYSVPPAFPSGPQYRFGTAPTHRGMGSAPSPADEAFQKAPRSGGRGMDGLLGAPGPGSYDVPDPPRGPAVTFGSSDARQLRVDQKEQVTVPGPGAYDIAVFTQASAAPTVPKAPRFNVEEGAHSKGGKIELGSASVYPMPGPGTYSPKASSIGEIGTGPSSAFPKAEREIIKEAHQPPASALAGEPSPGPGHYNVQDCLPDPSTSKGGTALKYTAARFGIQEEAGGKTPTPGPGHYDSFSVGKGGLSMEGAGPSFRQAERFPREPRTESAGDGEQGSPGWYDVPPMLQAPTSSFGKAPRFQEGRNLGLGPAISDHPEVVSAVGSPGPGSYDVAEAAKAILRRAPAFSLISRRNEDVVSGPHGDNFIEKKASLPGPGHYDVQNYRAVGEPGSRAAILSGRPKSGTIDTPGPGSYDINQNGIGWEAPAFSITGRAVARELGLGDNTPGFGSYDAASAFAQLHGTGPAFSIVGRSNIQSTRVEVPGPGHYELPPPPSGVSVGFSASASTTAATGTTKDARGPNNNDRDVGPGLYDVPAPPAGPAYSFYHSNRSLFNDSKIGGKGAPEGTESSPGPGSYYSLHVESEPPKFGPAISFPRAPRMNSIEEREAAATPGPGEYYRPPLLVQANSAVPAYSIIDRYRLSPQVASTTSGPPTYSSTMNWSAMEGSHDCNKRPCLGAEARPQPKQDVNPEPALKFTEGIPSEGTAVGATIQKLKPTEEVSSTGTGHGNANGGKPMRRVHFADEECEKPIPSSSFSNSFISPAEHNSMDIRAIYLEKLAKVGYPVKQKL